MYKKRIFAFIDILGFSDTINKTIKNGREVQSETKKILSLEKSFRYDANRQDDDQDPYHFNSRIFSHFSDSIVISYSPNDEAGIENILEDISNYQLTAILFDHLFRGAVVYDNIYHTKEIMFGPAMTRAYSLEGKMASFPRIILDDTIMPLVQKYHRKYSKRSSTEWSSGGLITKDFDGQYFLDYFASLMPAGDDIDVIAKTKNILTEKLAEKIKSMENIESYSVKSKYLWLKEKYDEYLNSENDSNAVINKILCNHPQLLRHLDKMGKAEEY